MVNKKSFEMQFNWLFVLIAGAVILLFFTTIVVRQKSLAETSTKATVLKSVEAIISGASVTTETVKIESIPKSKIDIECNRVSVGGVSRQYQNLILFAPSTISGNKLIWQTMSFSVPFRATNFLYMTSPHVRYILIGSNSLAGEINKSLPVEIKKEFHKTTSDAIKNQNDDKVRFVLFGNFEMSPLISVFSSMRDQDVTAVKVDESLKKVDFFEKKNSAMTPQGTSYYFTKPALMGAVYADSKEGYECSMKNAFSRLNVVTQIYLNRINKLPEAAQNSPCRVSYSSSEDELKKINDLSETLKNSYDNAQPDIILISNSAESLSEWNKELQKHSCPTIY